MEKDTDLMMNVTEEREEGFIGDLMMNVMEEKEEGFIGDESREED